MKVYQVPLMFIQSSEKPWTNEEASFIVVFYEKQMKKRTYAKSQTQKVRVRRREEIKMVCESGKVEVPRPLEDLMANRDSKMRRFCNYFLTLFNQAKLNPF